MALSLRVYYRGHLVSCNYDCHYCPFAKRRESAAEQRRDRESLQQFVAWVEAQPDVRLSILFTPWGEALVRSWYRDALIRLSRLPNVAKVAAQTNLSVRPTWLDESRRESTALWCTYHPSQVPRETFLERCRELQRLGVRFSVGMVGLRESFDEIETMRRELPADVYLWINACKDVPDYYRDAEIDRLERVDPWFHWNLTQYDSQGTLCEAGEQSVSIDGDGNMRRCHFVSEVIGNIHDPAWRRALAPRPCPNATCECYIGYIQIPRLRQHQLFGTGLLERAPDRNPWSEE